MSQIKIIQFTPEEEIMHLQDIIDSLTMVEGVEYLGGKVISIVCRTEDLAEIENQEEFTKYHDIVYQLTLKISDKKHPPTSIG